MEFSDSQTLIRFEKRKMKKELKRRIINWLLNIVIIVLLIVGAYLFLTRIFGSSPTDLQLILWLFGFSVTLILKIFNMIYSLNREIGEIKIQMKNSFDKVREDINKLQKSEARKSR